MGGIIAALYGALVYLLFFGTFLYAIGFIANLWVPKGIDSGTVVATGTAIVINVALLGVFAVQHSLMARPAFKRWWTKLVPESVERSTYVLFASLALILLYWFWRPLPTAVWSVGAEWARMLLWVIFWAGWGVLLVSTFLINHFELFGLRQVMARMSGRAIPPAVFRTPAFYRYVRHPIYLGFVLAFWAAPDMSLGRLLFAIGGTGYILAGIQLEERDLIGLFGQTYRDYRRRVPMLLPWRISGKKQS
jgi:protein-S-isoprenylcysteine O-methyltransferase Ste14